MRQEIQDATQGQTRRVLVIIRKRGVDVEVSGMRVSEHSRINTDAGSRIKPCHNLRGRCEVIVVGYMCLNGKSDTHDNVQERV